MISERLQKVVNMAKYGTGNEKAVAERIVRRECEKEGLDYDAVMSGFQHRNKKKENPSYNYGFSGFYSQGYSWGNTYSNQQYQQSKKDREEAEKKMWEDLKRASDEMNERMKNQKDKRERYYNRSTVTDFTDKHGTVWGVSELVHLSRTRRIDLFDGEDPLSA